MKNPVSVIMITNVVSVGSEDSIEKVEAVMNARNVSFAPVRDAAGKLFGVIDLQDVEHFRAAKKNLKTVQAWEICSRRVVQVDPAISIIEVAKLMVEKNIHIVVVAEGETIRGVVSSLDIVTQYIQQENHQERLTELPSGGPA